MDALFDAHVFEICQPPDDSSRMKQAVVATFLR